MFSTDFISRQQKMSGWIQATMQQNTIAQFCLLASAVVIDFTMRSDVFLYFYDLCAHKLENCKLQKELHNIARTQIFKGRDYKKCNDEVEKKICRRKNSQERRSSSFSFLLFAKGQTKFK